MAGQRAFARFTAIGHTLTGAVWLASQPEPVVPQLVAENNLYSTGYAAMGFRNRLGSPLDSPPIKVHSVTLSGSRLVIPEPTIAVPVAAAGLMLRRRRYAAAQRSSIAR